MKKLLLLVMAMVMGGCTFFGSPFPRTPAVPAGIDTYKKAVARWGPEAQLIKYNAGEVTGIWSEGKQVVALGGEFSCMWHVTAKEQRQYKARGPFLDVSNAVERTLVFNADGTVRCGSFMIIHAPLFIFSKPTMTPEQEANLRKHGISPTGAAIPRPPNPPTDKGLLLTPAARDDKGRAFGPAIPVGKRQLWTYGGGQADIEKIYVGKSADVIRQVFGQPASWKKQGNLLIYTYDKMRVKGAQNMQYSKVHFVVKPDPVKGGGKVVEVQLDLASGVKVQPAGGIVAEDGK